MATEQITATRRNVFLSFGFDIYDLSWLQDRDYRTLTDVAKRHFMRFIADEIDRFTYVLLH